MLLDAEDGPELEAPARHEQVRLVAGLALEGDGAVRQLLPREALRDEPNLSRPDDVDRLECRERPREREHDAEDHPRPVDLRLLKPAVEILPLTPKSEHDPSYFLTGVFV